MGTQSDRKTQILARLNFEAFYRQELQNFGPARGDNLQALCPFHDDKDPSLSVHLQTGLFKCFGCEAAGDVFAFYQLRHSVDFPAALAALARLAGVAKEPSPNEPTFKSLTLKEFVQTKKLPLEFLKKHGVSEFRFADGTVCVDFPYFDQTRRVIAIRHRFGSPKPHKFRFRKGDRAVTYGLWRLPKIFKAGWCLIVEGETDFTTAWLHGIPALGIPGKENYKCLKGLGLEELEVYLWEEPDAARTAKKAGLADKLGQFLPELRVIAAPAEFKDLSEAHCRGKHIPDLVKRLKVMARRPPPPPLRQENFFLSDLGNARRLKAQHGRDLRYCHPQRRWYCWKGTHWAMDNLGEVERRAHSVIDSIREGSEKHLDLNKRQALQKFAIKSEGGERVLAMIRLAQSLPGVPITPAEMDRDPWLLNCANGTIDLHTGELRPHRREDLVTRLVPVDYDPEAACDLWEKFLYRILPADVVDFVQRSLGYALTGSCKEQCLFILWGHGANGKSTLLGRISEVLGTYAMHTRTEVLLDKPNSGEVSNEIARLHGPRFVTAFEVGRGKKLSENLIKELTGQDEITARFLYSEPFQFVPQFKLFISTNTKPVIRDSTHAMERRLNLIPFVEQIPPEERDGELPEKLRAEWPGILAWLVRGCLDWQAGGLGVPVQVSEATAEYFADMNLLRDFLSDRCLIDTKAMSTAQDLYQSYLNWADDEGEKSPLSKRSFGLTLGEMGFQKARGGGGKRLWRGVGLLPPPPSLTFGV